MISNCGRDERGQYHGGKAGDQDHGEWKIVNWYNYPWYCILRHPSSDVRKLLADFARAAAENDHIGYDQWERLTFLEQLKVSDWNPANITNDCETDCSAGVTALTIAVGNILGIDSLKNLNPKLYTGNMRQAFKDAGFEVITDKKIRNSADYLLVGDILLNDSHHTVINLDQGSKVEASAPAQPANKSVEELAREVIAGKWGNGQERIDRLTAAGYNAAEIQNEVNRQLGITPKPSTPLAEEKTTFKVVNVRTSLNVRKGPGTSYPVVGSMHNGDTFTVSGSVVSQNNFTQVSEGRWVSNSYISRV